VLLGALSHSAGPPGSFAWCRPAGDRYELQLAPGTKVSKCRRSRTPGVPLASTEIRILAPIPQVCRWVECPTSAPTSSLGDIYREFPKAPVRSMCGWQDIPQASTRPQQAASLASLHRFRQERLRQLYLIVHLLRTRLSSALHHDRPEEGRAVALRPYPAPAVPYHQHEGRAGVLHNVCKEMEDATSSWSSSIAGRRGHEQGEGAPRRARRPTSWSSSTSWQT